jgi:hypothetical protein
MRKLDHRSPCCYSPVLVTISGPYLAPRASVATAGFTRILRRGKGITDAVIGLTQFLWKLRSDCRRNEPIRGEPPSRRNAFSCSSAHTRALDRSRRTHLRLQPRVMTNSRVRRYLPLSGSRTISPVP